MNRPRKVEGPEELAVLGNTGLLSGLAPQELMEVARAAGRIELAPGDELFHQDDPTTKVFILTRGQVRLLQNTPDGQQVLLRFIRPGEVIGIVAALEGSVYPATAQATEASSAFQWKGKALRELMERYPRIALNVIPFLISRVHEVQDRFRELATERVERRVARLLSRLVRQVGKKAPGGIQIGMPLTRQDIAEMTGTTLYTVSRVLSQWEQQGIVKAGRKKVLITQPHALVAIAEDLPLPSKE